MDLSMLIATSTDVSAQEMLSRATFIAAGTAFFLLASRVGIIWSFSRIAGRTRYRIDDAVLAVARTVHVWALVLISILSGVLGIGLAAPVYKVALALLIIVVVYESSRALGTFIEEVGHKERVGPNRRLVSIAVQVLVWMTGFLFLLSSVGINITSLVAGLGIGGIVLGFALQAVLEDLFSSFSIHFDKPFSVGDFIIVGSELGTVERIGLKSSRIRALEGEQISISNKDLTSSRIRNYKRMRERRAIISFRLLLETPTDKLRLVPGMAKAAIESMQQTRFDRAHLKEFSADSFVYEVVYYILSPDYNLYADINQEILLKLRASLDDAGISLAYPTRLVEVRQQG